MKKKYLAGILAATLLTGTLFGCGSQGSQGAAAPAPADSRVEAQTAESVESKAQSESTVPQETPAESQVATPTPEPEPDYSAAYAAYLGVLQENQNYINAYDWQKSDPDVTLSADDREIGGLGVFMVKKNMDELKYQYLDGQNRLTMFKTL